MSEELLRGLAVALHGHISAVRRRCDADDGDQLRRDMALVAAMVDRARGAIGEDAIAALSEEAEAAYRERSPIELDVAEGYRLWSRDYDDGPNVIVDMSRAAVDRLLGDVAGRRVLDVGCGTGQLAVELAGRGAGVIGVDPSPAMLDKARRLASLRGVAVDFMDAGFGSLPCGEPFDIVTCNLVLCHLPEVAGPIAEMASCLAPGGRLIITDFHYLCLVIGWRTAFTCDDQRYHIENHVHDFGEYSRAIADAGLTIVEMSDMRVDELLRGTNWEGLIERWEGLPLAQVVAADKPG